MITRLGSSVDSRHLITEIKNRFVSSQTRHVSRLGHVSLLNHSAQHCHSEPNNQTVCVHKHLKTYYYNKLIVYWKWMLHDHIIECIIQTQIKYCVTSSQSVRDGREFSKRWKDSVLRRCSLLNNISGAWSTRILDTSIDVGVSQEVWEISGSRLPIGIANGQHHEGSSLGGHPPSMNLWWTLLIFSDI